MTHEIKTMRDVFITELTARMRQDSSIFFVTADFGAPTLDALVNEFPERFVNVGIAEQNLINVSTGLALEGFKVYAYAIAPFITMRCFEQIKVNLSMTTQLRDMNVNLIGVGAGFSYVVSGPTHHSIEDISIIHTLPNIEILSPADWVSVQQMVDFTLNNQGVKYLRFDSAPGQAIYAKPEEAFASRGFNIVAAGTRIALVGTGFMVHQALEIKKTLAKDREYDPTVIDIYRLRGFDRKSLAQELSQYELIISLEEAFIGKGGLDSIILHTLNEYNIKSRFRAVGIADCYRFALGNREELLANYNCSKNDVINLITESFSDA
jgi:transketolase